MRTITSIYTNIEVQSVLCTLADQINRNNAASQKTKSERRSISYFLFFLFSKQHL